MMNLPSLRTTFLACLLFMVAQAPAQSVVLGHAIAGQPDPLHDYVLPISNYSYSGNDYPYASGSSTRYWANGLMMYSISSSGFYDRGTWLGWTSLGGISYGNYGYFGQVAMDTTSACSNPGPQAFNPGDTIDGRSSITWYSSSLELENPGGANCVFSNPGPIYYGVRYIFPLQGGGSDTAYGYWGGIPSRVHLAMDSLPTFVGLPAPADPATFSIYPNPAENLLHVQWAPQAEHTTLSILDLRGRVLMEHVVQPASSEVTLAVMDLPAGTYLVRASGAQGLHKTQRFVKQ